MKYLLDTCVLIWALEGDDIKLGKFKELILDTKNNIFISIASYWEIIIKQTLGRITVNADLAKAVLDSGFTWLDIKILHLDYIKELPLIHNDPFDRLLVAQSKTENLTILTTDSKILQYK
ncbi:Type II toxin-antitoxin system VapC family toxin [Candidatus Trichorickettsia mobilis]|uniref:Type II toxin-antitoxin system VapC family toxin n=1 Tax=Candidatus Trichorickettsia mobilis TaxID=1346319 RepID=A0ABZ0UTD5_9RICK|nr:type II toxin-antitoxin system VapC family toxin [Candidatus Trichorickettsia mobilis]WPY01294.1 Type II toxin-antitoxin system VapC family toxin [Candidatus Trichorickettsia mobilis]